MHDPVLHSIFQLLEINKHSVVLTMKCTVSGRSQHPNHTSLIKTHAQKAHPWDVNQPPARNDFYHKKLCCLSCLQITSTPPKIPLPGTVFLGLSKCLCSDSKISHGCMLQYTDSCLFQKLSKSVQDKCPKSRRVLVTQKTKTCFDA